MKKSILNLGKALHQDQLKQISGGQPAPTSSPYNPSGYDSWGDDCENHNHFYEHNSGRWLCLTPE